MRVPSRYLFPLQPAAAGVGVVGFAVLFALLAGGFTVFIAWYVIL